MALVRARSTRPIDFDEVIRRLATAFPGTRVIRDDYYAERIRREREISESLGMPTDNIVVQCTERVADEHGLCREIEIPLSAESRLVGRLDRTGCLLVAPRLTEQDLFRLAAILEKFGLEIEASNSAADQE